MMKVEFYGGPLDGAEEEGERFGNILSYPDPTAPTERVIIYLLFSCPNCAADQNRQDHAVARFSQVHTNMANQRVQEGP
jgi:hypothetical protein